MTPENLCVIFILLKSKIWAGVIYVAHRVCPSSFTFKIMIQNTQIKQKIVSSLRYGYVTTAATRSFICDFLLVANSNWAVSPIVSENADFTQPALGVIPWNCHMKYQLPKITACLYVQSSGHW